MNANEVLDGALNQEIAGHPIGDAGEWLAPSNEDKPTLQIDALSSWLRTVSQHGLLSREQEIGLAKGIESARDELLQANLRLVVSVAT